ncbi:MAG: hypothetical protein OXC12_08355 [Spirochaetaceae bacterium]|nr:hypothetical protein [Spirochaetaceae bacterium]
MNSHEDGQSVELSPAGEVRRGVRFGLLAGVAAIACCWSPVVFVLLGIAGAAQAVTLGDTLYYGYGWWFRGFGLAVAAAAVVVHLRRRDRCTLSGARRSWRLLAALPVAGVATYAALFWFTKYLGIWFG